MQPAAVRIRTSSAGACPAEGERRTDGEKRREGAGPGKGRQSSKGSRLAGALLSVFGGVCWGCSGSVGQYLFRHEGMDSRWLVPIRLGSAGVILFVYCLFRYGRRLFGPWRNQTLRRDLLLYGLAGVSGCQFLYFLTIQLSSAGIGTILQDLAPIMVLLWTCLIGRRGPRRREVLCIALAIGGVTLIVTHGDPAHLAVPPTALLTGVLSAVCVMIYNVAPVRLLRRYPVSVLQAWAFLGGGLSLSLIFRPWTRHYVPTAAGWAGIAFVVLIGNVLAFNCYATGVKLAGPQKAVLYGFAEPVTAAVISATLLGSVFTLWDAAGFVMIFLMMVLIS